jgi:hypothetical protein
VTDRVYGVTGGRGTAASTLRTAPSRGPPDVTVRANSATNRVNSAVFAQHRRPVIKELGFRTRMGPNG